MSAAGGVTCKINERVVTRTTECERASLRVNVLRNGKQVGYATFTVSHEMTLNSGSRSWSEKFNLSKATLVGTASGIKTSVTASCGGTCKASTSFPAGHSLGSPASGSVKYTDSVGKKHKNLTHTTYRYSFLKAGYTPGSTSYQSVNFRCDDAFWAKSGKSRTKAPGCVFPTAPTAISMAGLPGISKGIRALRSRGGHLGDPAAGKPLHMITDEATATKNRTAVCGGKKPPNWGSNLPPLDRPSCDEYPFATTSEGGTHVAANQRTITWVTVRENNTQGGRITAFKKKYRVMDTDPFYVTA
ncbi:NucA/NucB deoxyribonuclease domain-containing protein [Streptomyces sp. NPDC090053]|uniref:NucA/NucB deoxyribonuclease domain-containing protein n=1 Tax=Streptomyces sp. NPDC090053 TaxID=3365932 RepID=UPI003800087B